LTSLISDMN